MKKFLSIVIGIIIVSTVFVACSKAPVNDDSNSESDNSATIQDEASSENDFEYSTEQPSQNSKPRTYKKNVIMSFNAVEGAVIYDQSYESNGYLESCQFHKKCEACGYVSNSNGQARGNLSTSYHCTQCGNNQAVEITANFEWVEVPYEN